MSDHNTFPYLHAHLSASSQQSVELSPRQYALGGTSLSGPMYAEDVEDALESARVKRIKGPIDLKKRWDSKWNTLPILKKKHKIYQPPSTHSLVGSHISGTDNHDHNRSIRHHTPDGDVYDAKYHVAEHPRDEPPITPLVAEQAQALRVHVGIHGILSKESSLDQMLKVEETGRSGRWIQRFWQYLSCGQL